ncbi:MAG: 50S ribosomal protein L4 [Deltaproteobacteria bacterium]|jgi:large subunit ribosomal protein L4|nr:50S ribosomal protein L4 [Deltaproteobacteria bacterium]
MPTVDVVNLELQKVGEVELAEAIWDVEPKAHLVHEVVVAQLRSRRAGTACTKTRAEVAFSNRKPYSQKKTGRARAGTRRSPLWRKGGTIFGPKPRDFYYRPPAKIRRLALKSALTAKLRENELLVLDQFSLPEIKTKNFCQSMKSLGLGQALVVTPEPDRNLEMSSRNLKNFKVLRVDGLNCYDLLRHSRLVILRESLPVIEERLLK